MTTLADIQRRVGVTPDGVWGPATAAAIWAALPTMAAPKAVGPLTVRVLGEIVSHEAIVQEWYKDSEGIGTWGIGVTNASGHNVDGYRDNPQPVRKCLEIYLWLLRTRYLPDVQKAFAGRELTEAQIAAALSFHYNTGAILRADWVKSWMNGRPTTAKSEIMNWKSPPSIIERREKERDLFFGGQWSGDGTALLIPVRKPSYTPDWSRAKRINITSDLVAIGGAA